MPTIFNFAISNAINSNVKNNNKSPFGLDKLAEPDALSKGFILLLFVFTLLLLGVYDSFKFVLFAL